MPGREEPFVNGEYYHIFNRGVAKQEIFLKPRHYSRFERLANYYKVQKPGVRFSKYLQLNTSSQLERFAELKTKENLVEIVAFCCMPNHFHFLIKQLCDGGISQFMQLLSNAYTRYFNTVQLPTRIGPLFQGHFKSVHVKSEPQLIHLSRYIHINPRVGNVVSRQDFESYPYSSYSQYVNTNTSGLIAINPSIILGLFRNKDAYRDFCLDYSDYALTISAFKHDLIDGSD